MSDCAKITVNIPLTVGKVHHYRETCPPEQLKNYCLTENFREKLTRDTAVRKLEKRVLKNLVMMKNSLVTRQKLQARNNFGQIFEIS